VSNHDFDTVVASADEKIRAGGTVYQKFTCQACGNRLTMDVPNTFYTSGTCDRCGSVTDIKAAGHNFLLIMSAK
jgi:hypothetical protein